MGNMHQTKWENNGIKKQGKIDAYATIVILGISNGVHIKQIMESAPKNMQYINL